jgi:HD-GYP domain-containing protein (c-di-GMP phosphodiesterase class II)
LPRIIAVADTFDALTTNRPYQQAHDAEQALRIIHSLAGKRLDPAPIAALDAIYARGDIRIQKRTSAPVPAPTLLIDTAPATIPDQSPASEVVAPASLASLS